MLLLEATASVWRGAAVTAVRCRIRAPSPYGDDLGRYSRHKARTAARSSFATEIENASSGSTPFSPPTRGGAPVYATHVAAKRESESGSSRRGGWLAGSSWPPTHLCIRNRDSVASLSG